MRSSVTSRYLELYRNAVHPLLAIFPPFLFLLSIEQALRILLPGVRFLPPLYYLLVLLAGVEEAIVGNLLFRERVSFLARLRELILLLLLSFGLLELYSLLVGRGLQPQRFELLEPLFLVLAQWVISLGFHDALRERELLHAPLQGLSGSRLRHALRDSSYEAGAVLSRLRHLKAAVIAFQAIVFLLLVVPPMLGRPLQPAGPSLFVLHALGGLFALGLLNSFVQEQLLVGQGMVVGLRFERRRVVFLAALLVTAGFLTLLAARDASLLPLSALLAFLQRLAGLLRFRHNAELSQNVQKLLTDQQQYYRLLQAQEQARANPVALLLLELLRRLFLSLGGAALFLFLVSPLLSPEFLSRLRELHPLRALRERLRRLGRGLRRGLQSLLAWLRFAGRRRLPLEEDASREEQRRRLGLAGGPLSLRKRVQMGRVLRAFLQLLQWGETLGIRRWPANTPQEYTGRLAAALPERAEELGFVTEVFEEVMFSRHLVASGRTARYFDSIRRLRRFRAPAQR